jgi:hypothetical protein
VHVPQAGNQKFAACVENAGGLWDLECPGPANSHNAVGKDEHVRIGLYCTRANINNIGVKNTDSGRLRLSNR